MDDETLDTSNVGLNLPSVTPSDFAGVVDPNVSQAKQLIAKIMDVNRTLIPDGKNAPKWGADGSVDNLA